VAQRKNRGPGIYYCCCTVLLVPGVLGGVTHAGISRGMLCREVR
jgi:hypothetical protein